MNSYFRYGLLRTVVYFMMGNVLANNLVLLFYLEWEQGAILILGTAIILFFAFLGLLGSLAIGLRALIGFRNLGIHATPLFLLLLNLPLNSWYVYVLHQAN